MSRVHRDKGFRPDYIIDRGMLEDGTIVHFTLEQQGYMCGNSVCPSEAEALISANYVPREVERPARRRRATDETAQLFVVTAE